MSKLTKKQKKFLKGIENKKARYNQKQQFKLQNKFDSMVFFVDGKFQTSNPNHIAILSSHPMNGILFKEEVDCKDKTWYETQITDYGLDRSDLVHKVLNLHKDKNLGELENFLSNKKEENALSKESLRDLTEPKQESYFDKDPIDYQIKINNCRGRLEDALKEFNKVRTEKMLSSFLKAGRTGAISKSELNELNDLTNPNPVTELKWYEVSEDGITYYWFVEKIDYENQRIIGKGFDSNDIEVETGSILYRNHANFNWFLENAKLADMYIVFKHMTERIVSKNLKSHPLTPNKKLDYGDFDSEEVNRHLSDEAGHWNFKPLEFDLPKKEPNPDNFFEDVLNIAKLYDVKLLEEFKNYSPAKKKYTIEDMEKCFNESRLPHFAIGFKWDDFSRYLNSLK